MERLKQALRSVFYRSALARFLIGVASVITGRTRSLRVIHLLSYVDQKALGPLQRPEALLLNAIAQVVRPRVVVEFGFFKGHSAFNFLQALSDEAKIYSYDVAGHAEKTARESFRRFRNFRFLHKSQAEFVPEDIASQKVDLVFFDAVHDLSLNQETWRRIESSLSDRCIVIVHDTGTWPRADALAVYGEADLLPERWLANGEYEHQPGERQFVNWVTAEYAAYGMIHFHSLETLRHGLTILQKQQRLTTSAAETHRQ